MSSIQGDPGDPGEADKDSPKSEAADRSGPQASYRAQSRFFGNAMLIVATVVVTASHVSRLLKTCENVRQS
jgi:hypothetical protein